MVIFMCNTNIYKYAIVILGILTGIIAGALYYTGILTTITAVIPFFAVISAVILALEIALLLIYENKKKAIIKCLCIYGGIIAFSSILSIALVLLTLSVTLVATSLLSAFLIGSVVAATAGSVLGLLFFILCVISKKCPCSQNQSNNCNCCCINTQVQNTSCDFDLE